MEASEEAIIAGLLHDTTLGTNEVPIQKIQSEFCERIVKIIMDVKDFNSHQDSIDEDVIMVKLADRLHNMRTIEFMDETRWEEKARETLEIFLPIAAKLNNEKVMAELNDLSVRYI
jgi:GTP pyrophosphokinase